MLLKVNLTLYNIHYYLGVYLSRHSDCVAPSYSILDIPIRMLICKVLPGLVKRFAPTQGMWSATPEINYNSHSAAFPPKDLITLAPHKRFRYSQIFIYEYDQSGRTVAFPSAILPTAVVTLTITKPGYFTN